LIISYFSKKIESNKKYNLKKFNWSKSDINNKLKVKKYKNYDEYIKHQSSKLEKLSESFINEYDIKYREILYKRLLKQNLVKPNMNVLCLATRIGTEVKAFIDIGCFAIGIDINPGTLNEYVVYGDFHDIQFAPNSIDVVFSNSIDHSFNLEILIKEIKRVLKINGLLII
ncbi:MAG: class I SAM-dependent methyltransferase, partial [Actinobacteria bacterium]|nr:class I SAM-dependent methyltransferase [Actinomycetota bacterium]